MTRPTPKTTCEWGKRRARGRGEVWKASMVGGHPHVPKGIRVLCVPSSPIVPATAVTRTHSKRGLSPVHFSRSSQSTSPIRQTQRVKSMLLIVHTEEWRTSSPWRAPPQPTTGATPQRGPVVITPGAAHTCSPHTAHDTADNPHRPKHKTEDARTPIGGKPATHRKKKKTVPQPMSHLCTATAPRDPFQPFTGAHRRAKPRCGGGA